jgi:hypothetical protein
MGIEDSSADFPDAPLPYFEKASTSADEREKG